LTKFYSRKLGSSAETGKAAAGKAYTFRETLEHIKPYANVITACGTLLIVGGSFVKVISDIKGDVSDIRGEVGKLREVTDEKLSRLQAITDGKFRTMDEKFSKLQATTDGTFRTMDEKFSKLQATIDEKFSKLQATTAEKFRTMDAKFDTVRAQASLKATNTHLKLNHNQKYATASGPNSAAGVGVADPSAKQDGV
jgi:hypothetical protein